MAGRGEPDWQVNMHLYLDLKTFNPERYGLDSLDSKRLTLGLKSSILNP